MDVLVTGGAGFIGSSLCLALKSSFSRSRVCAFDNLRRRGSELNLARFREADVQFVHGDIRQAGDVLSLPGYDVIIECSAEPSVLAATEDTGYSYETNLTGAFNCLELAKRDGSKMVFLSTSRVYPIKTLRNLAYSETDTRFELKTEQDTNGASGAGVAEDFPLVGARSFYGATKLAAELVIEEYRDAFGIEAVIDRCGVVSGPWQMGKVDQGVFTHWLLCHHFNLPLSYIGYGGSGKQVRDLMHVDDLVDLVLAQICDFKVWDGHTVNVGGGRDVSLSLRETTEICSELTGNELEIGSVSEDRAGDVPIYLTDSSRAFSLGTWKPKRDAGTIMADIYSWVRKNESILKQSLEI